MTKPKQAGGQVTPEFEAYVSLAGLIDSAAEVKRLEKQIAEKQKQLAGHEGEARQRGLRRRAPAEVVQQQRELVADLEKQIASMEETIRELKT